MQETSHQCKTIKKSVQFIHPATGTDFKCNIKIRGGAGGVASPRRSLRQSLSGCGQSPHHLPPLAYCPLCADVLGVLVPDRP